MAAAKKTAPAKKETKAANAVFKFDKELFKRSVLYNVKTLYRKNMDEASEQQIFQAVSYAIKDQIVDNWLKTQEAYEKEDPKTVYYLSMEFLMGRALGNNMINLMAYKDAKDALEELGLDINMVEDQEPDAALGNGGLGRLAACFLDSLATLGYSAYGCGIRYRYGMFKQQIRDGYQVEVPDNWLADGNPFELRRPEYTKEVRFGGYVNVRVDENGRNNYYQEGYQAVKAVPYDLPIVGYGNGIDIGIGNPCVFYGAFHHFRHRVRMRAGGNFGHYAPEQRLCGRGRRDLIGQDFPAANHRRRRFVTGRFNC